MNYVYECFAFRCCCVSRKASSDITKVLLPEIQLEEELAHISWKTCVPFVPPINLGKVIKVYDGDTITIAQKLPYENSPLFRFAIRLNGIDSPEIKTKHESEKKYAERSRDALHQLIFEKKVTLKNISLEKYGRILADIYYNDIHVNKWLLDNKYAIPYDGTKKREWNDVITLYEKSN